MFMLGLSRNVAACEISHAVRNDQSCHFDRVPFRDDEKSHIINQSHLCNLFQEDFISAVIEKRILLTLFKLIDVYGIIKRYCSCL